MITLMIGLTFVVFLFASVIGSRFIDIAIPPQENRAQQDDAVKREQVKRQMVGKYVEMEI